jgi:hypothetical protein
MKELDELRLRCALTMRSTSKIDSVFIMQCRK